MNTRHCIIYFSFIADVYVELEGGRQAGMDLSAKKSTSDTPISKKAREPRSFSANDEELEAHAKLVEGLTNPIWRD